MELRTTSKHNRFYLCSENELSGNSIPEQKAKEIEKHIYSGEMDHHSLQAIMDILISIPRTNVDDSIARLCDRFKF